MKTAVLILLSAALAFPMGGALGQKKPSHEPVKELDAAALASDEAAFNKLRQDTQRRNASSGSGLPMGASYAPRAKPQAASGDCQYKAVMSEADMAACRKK
jgi:hypothetical protein